MATSSTNWRKTAEAIAIPLGALLFALVLFGLFCALNGKNPFAVYSLIFRSAFSSWRAFQGTLLRAAPLMLTALCTALPARLGLMIIGNEGALVMGGLGAAIVGLLLSFGSVTPSPEQLQQVSSVPSFFVLFGMAMAAIFAGGIWIAIAGALRHYRAVNETISSLLMNYIAIAVMNQLVAGAIKDPGETIKASSFALPEVNRLTSLPGTRIHYGLLYGIIVCILAYVLIQKTTFGFAARTAGGNVKAARIAGLPVGKLTIIICFLAGSCAGLAGMAEVAAVHGRVNESLIAGYGYTGILVAFVARYNPIACILVAILLGGIISSGGALQRNLGMPDATVLVFQGLVFLVILYSDSLYGRFKIFKESAPAAPPPAPSTALPV
jgi:simple sugar transport system permease protein